MTCRDQTLEIASVALVAFGPPLITATGATAATYALNELLNATTKQALIESFVLLVAVWLAIPIVKALFVLYVMRTDLSLCSRRARYVAPWLLAAGFIASLIAYALYSPFFAAFKEGWRQLTEFAYFTPIVSTYLIVASRLIHEY
jgi:hypothetical protein